MSKRSTMVLGAIAVALMALVVYDRGTLSTGELEARRGRVIESFVRARVSRIELTAGETHVVLQRAANEEEEDLDTFGVGDWSMEAPVHAGADSESVDGLMSTLEWLDARRTIDGISSDDRHLFGLDAPRATVDFTVASESHHLVIGGDDPRGEGLYVTLDDRDTAWICGRDLLEALQHDADWFRSKDLFDGFRPRDARHVEITNADTHAVLERETSEDGQAGNWRLTDPVHGFARTAAVDGLLQFATHARATRFMEEPGSDLATPTREIRIERAPASGDAADEDRSPMRLRVVGPCPDHAEETLAVVNDGPVVCVLTSDIEPLEVSLEQLRELRLVSTPDDRVDTLTLAHGDVSFTLRRTESGWRLVEGEGEGSEADEDAVAELMDGLRAQQAQELVPFADDAAHAHGIDAPSSVITITRTDDGPAEIVTLGASDAVGIWVRRGDEEQIGRFDLAARDLVQAAPIAFRSRHIVDRDPDDATEVRITRGTATEVVTHAEDGWHLTEPAASIADEASVRDVTRGVGGLTAVRFASPTQTAAQGLDHPRYVVTVHFAAPETHDDEEDHHDDDQADEHVVTAGDVTIHVGAATDGGAFATFGEEPAVFVVATAFVDALALPLASRDLLAIPSGDISALSITGPGGAVALRESGDAWVTELGPVPTGPATALFDRLSSLHASGVEPYGTAMPAAVITLEATHRSDASVTRVEIGPVVAGESPYRLARISGVPVVFRIPDEAATAFSDYHP